MNRLSFSPIIKTLFPLKGAIYNIDLSLYAARRQIRTTRHSRIAVATFALAILALAILALATFTLATFTLATFTLATFTLATFALATFALATFVLAPLATFYGLGTVHGV